jgi:TonB family protein
MLSTLIGIFLQATAPAPSEPAVAPSLIAAPDWIRRPTGEDFAHYYPTKALRAEVTGRAVLSCEVTAEGALAGCKVLEDFPANFGFGEAVLKMAPLFRMRPITKDGQPVAGGVVRIPIRFLLPGPSGLDALSVVLACYGQTAVAAEGEPANVEFLTAYTFFATQVAFREREGRALPRTFEANLVAAREGVAKVGPKAVGVSPRLDQCLTAFRNSQKPQ